MCKIQILITHTSIEPLAHYKALKTIKSIGSIMISDDSIAWIKALNKFYKTGDENDLPPNADINNTYVFDAMKKWKLIKKQKKQVY